MKSRVSCVAALLLAGCGGYHDPPTSFGAGPPLTAEEVRGERSDGTPVGAPLQPDGAAPTPSGYRPSTGERPGEARYDEVGYAGLEGEQTAGATAPDAPNDTRRMNAAHASPPVPSFAEVTALDTGRTILVRIDQRRQSGRDRIIDLSLAAAEALGLRGGPTAGVRVRAVHPLPADAAALAAGRPVVRADVPAPVLAALRRKLPPATTGPVTARAASAPAMPSRPAGGQPSRAAAGRYLVQVAALSSAERARAVAQRLGGRVVTAGHLHRIQLGPFADSAGAERARGLAAKAGFGDARVISSN